MESDDQPTVVGASGVNYRGPVPPVPRRAHDPVDGRAQQGADVARPRPHRSAPRFGGRVLNTHPSLLPDFPGAHAVRDALQAGATRAGATLFWVDAGVDTGEIIAQVEVPVLAGDDEAALTERIKAAETPQLIEQIHLLIAPGR